MADELSPLAARAGVPVRVLRAIATVESGYDPGRVRFEPHVFHERTNVSESLVPWTRSRGAVSLVASETNRDAFERAARLDYDAAVRSTSWGRYQVLGGAGIRLYGDARSFVAAFDRDPARVSNELLGAWFEARPPAVAAAVEGDWPRLAELYNGSRTSPWLGRFLAALGETETPWWVWPLGFATLGGVAAAAFWYARRTRRERKRR